MLKLPATLRRDAIVAAGVLLVGGAIAVGATSDDDGRGVLHAASPNGERFPVSRAVDPRSLEYRGKIGDADAYLAKGVGPAAGMTCLVIATADVTRTACDTPSAVEANGLVLSKDAGPDRLSLTGFMPGGVTVGADSDLHAHGELFDLLIPSTRPTVRVERAGRVVGLTVPGASR